MNEDQSVMIAEVFCLSLGALCLTAAALGGGPTGVRALVCWFGIVCLGLVHLIATDR